MRTLPWLFSAAAAGALALAFTLPACTVATAEASAPLRQVAADGTNEQRLEALLAALKGDNNSGHNVKQDIAGLRKAQALYQTRYTFKPGDIVEWKPGLKNKRGDGPFVVIGMLVVPVQDTVEDAGSPYFQERLDIVLGHFDSEGDFLMYHYDSKRMQPYKED